LNGWPASNSNDLSAKKRLAEPLNYVRFFVTDYFNTGRVIYLDSDVLIRNDLALLDTAAAVGFSENPDASVAIVPRDYKKVCGHVVHCTVAAKFANTTTEQLSQRLQAFNAGVFVINLQNWRNFRIKEKVAYWIRLNLQYRIYDLGSNPPLVLAIAQDYVRLDPHWNCLRGLRKQHYHNTICWDQAYIRHFPGDLKPWKQPISHARAIGWEPPNIPSSAYCRAALTQIGLDPVIFSSRSTKYNTTARRRRLLLYLHLKEEDKHIPILRSR